MVSRLQTGRKADHHPQTYALGYIQAARADRIQQFYSAHLNPYLNYHRPCAQADVELDAKGRKAAATAATKPH